MTDASPTPTPSLVGAEPVQAAGPGSLAGTGAPTVLLSALAVIAVVAGVVLLRAGSRRQRW